MKSTKQTVCAAITSTGMELHLGGFEPFGDTFSH